MYRARSAILVSLLLILLAGTCFARSKAEGENVPDPASRQSSPTLLDSILCWAQRAAYSLSDLMRSCVSSLRRFSQARHQFYASILSYIFPSRFSFRSGSLVASSGATEPTSIPEPPTIEEQRFLDHLLRVHVRGLVMKRILRQYMSSPIADVGACLDVVDTEIVNLFDIAISHLDSFCQSNVADRKFCKVFEHNNKRGAVIFFSRMNVDPVRAVVMHAKELVECTEWFEYQLRRSAPFYKRSPREMRRVHRDNMFWKLSMLCDCGSCHFHKALSDFRSDLKVTIFSSSGRASQLFQTAIPVFRTGGEFHEHIHKENKEGDDVEILKTGGNENPGTAAI